MFLLIFKFDIERAVKTTKTSGNNLTIFFYYHNLVGKITYVIQKIIYYS